MKTTILTLALSLLSIISLAQDVEYKTLVDDPDKVKPILIGVNPLVADTWNTNSYMGIGVFVHANVLKYGSVNLSYTKAFLDMVNLVKNHRGIELDLAYNVLSFKKEKDLAVVLSSSLIFTQTMRISSSTFISVPGTKKSILQARSGINDFKTGFDSYEFESTPFSFVENYDLERNMFHSTLKMKYLYGGLSWHTVNNLVIQHNGSSLASNCNDYNFYFDYLYMPFALKFNNAFDYNPFSSDTPGMALTPTLGAGATIKKAGWRLGWEARKNNILGGLTYKTEFGVRPGLVSPESKGILSRNAYLLLTAGFTFPTSRKY